MERLTTRYKYNGENHISVDREKNGIICSNYCTNCRKADCDDIRAALFKLAEYEDLEEQGLLIRLPCKACSATYLICSRYTKCSKHGEEFEEYDCQGCEDECDSHKEYYIHKNLSVDLEWIVRNINRFGKTVFLTQSEAEEALRKMKESTDSLRRC